MDVQKKFITVAYKNKNKKIAVQEISCASIYEIVKERFNVTEPDVKYYDNDVDDWVDLEIDSDECISNLKVLKVKVQDTTESCQANVKSFGSPAEITSPDSANTDATLIRRSRSPVSRPDTPVGRPESPVSRPETPKSRPESPVSRAETPKSRPETPATMTMTCQYTSPCHQNNG